MKKIFLLLLMVLAAFDASTQAVFDIKPTANDTILSSYLLGIGRNHIIANTTKGDPSPSKGKENRLDEKLNLFGAIENSSTNGLVTNNRKKVYRLGHSPTEGLSQVDYGSAAQQPGWHWATDYKHKGNIDSVLVLDETTYRAKQDETLGAGVHRYFFEAKYGVRNSADKISVKEGSINGNEATFPDYLTSVNSTKEYFGGFLSSYEQGYHIDIQTEGDTTAKYQFSVVFYNSSSVQQGIFVHPDTLKGNYNRVCFTVPANTAYYKMIIKQATGVNIQIKNIFMDGLERFSGYTVTINYENDVNFSEINCPKSRTITLPDNKISCKASIALEQPTFSVSNKYVARQISGPTNGELRPGSYLIEYRITEKSNGGNYGDLDVGYCGYVVSVNTKSTNIRLARTTRDTMLFITKAALTNLGSNPTASAILNAHRKTVPIRFPKLVNNASYNEDSVYAAVATLPLGANLFHSKNVLISRYDNLSFYLDEADTLKSDLSVVINVSSGYPEETVGLLRYLKALNKTIAYVELGNETMGNWQKGNYDYEGNSNLDGISWKTPQGIGRLTIPFAKRIKTSTYSPINQVKIATTSSYRLQSSFKTNPASYSALADEWLNALSEGTTCYVDYMNFHSYTNNAVSTFVSNSIPKLREKMNHSLAVFSLFENTIVPQMKSGIGNRNVGMLISEGHFGDKVDASITPENWRIQLSMMQGINFAETFRIAASKQFYAITPFAFLKVNKSPTADNWTAGTPTTDSIKIRDTDDFVILYYHNTTLQAHKKDSIYVKPTFRIMQMLGTSLGSKLVNVQPINVPKLTGNTQFEYDILPEQNINFDAISVLATKAGGDTLQVMIINKSSSTDNPSDGEIPLQYDTITLRVNNVAVANGSIKYIAASSIVDKDPVSSPSTDVNGNYATRTSYAKSVPGNPFIGGGKILIPKFSVCVVTMPPMNTTQPMLSINDVTVKEGFDGYATLTISSNVALPANFSVPVSYTNESAVAGSDYSSMPTSVSTDQTPGGFTMQLTVPIIDNTTFEQPETFKVTLGAGAGYSLSDGEGIVTILDNDDPNGGNCSTVTITPMAGMIKVGNIANGGHPIKVKIRLIGSSTYLVNQDYANPPSTLTFPSSGTYANGSYEVTVRYNDASYNQICSIIDTIVVSNTVSLSIEDQLVNENAGFAYVKVKATPTPSAPVSVTYNTVNGTATAPSDYGAQVNVTLNFGVNDSEKIIAIPIVDNTVPNDGDRTFVVNLSNPIGATLSDGSATVTIADDDPSCNLTIMVYNYTDGVTISGMNGKRTIVKVTPISPTTGAVTRDTILGQNTYNIPRNVGKYVVSYKVYNSSGQVTCQEDVELIVLPKLTIGDVTVNEGADSATVTVTANAAALSGSTMSFIYGTMNGSATGGQDYTGANNVTLSFSTGSLTKSFTVPIINDTAQEPTETFTVKLIDAISAEIANESATITIIDNDSTDPCAGITITANSTNTITIGGMTSQYSKIKILNSAFASVFSQTYSPAPGTITTPAFAAGTYTVKVTFLQSDYSTVICFKELEVIVGGTPPLPTLSIADITVNENVGNANAIISLSAPHNAPVTVSYATQQVTTSALSNSDFTPINANVTIPAGATSVTTSIAIVEDAVAEPQEYFNVHLSTSSGLAITDGVGTVTILDNDGTLCDNVTISTGASFITVANMNQPSAVICKIQIQNSNYTVIYDSIYNSPNIPNQRSFSINTGGSYFVKVKYFTASNVQICSQTHTVTVPNSQGNNTNAVTIGEISKSAPSTQEVVQAERKHKKVLLYPNPTSGKFYLNIEGFDGKLLTIQLIDQYGRALQVEKRVYADDLEMNIGNHPDGTYFLQILAENESPIVERILLQSASIHTHRQ